MSYNYGYSNRNYRRESSGGSFGIMLLVVFFLAIGIYFVGATKNVFTTGEAVGTVIDKSVKRNGSSEDFYLIYTRDADGKTQVLKIDDSWLHGNFDASDDYMDIEVGKTYNFKVQGTRVPFLSWYPNIYEYAEIATDD